MFLCAENLPKSVPTTDGFLVRHKKNQHNDIMPQNFQIFVQDRTDFMQLLMNAQKEQSEEKQEDKEHDKEFKEMHKGVPKRGWFK